MVRLLIPAGLLLDVVGLALFLSVFFSTAMLMGSDEGPHVGQSHEEFRRRMHDESREAAHIFARAPIGMGLMIVGTPMWMVGLVILVANKTRRERAADEAAGVCSYCKAKRRGFGPCGSCGAA